MKPTQKIIASSKNGNESLDVVDSKNHETYFSDHNRLSREREESLIKKRAFVKCHCQTAMVVPMCDKEIKMKYNMLKFTFLHFDGKIL